MNDAQKKPLAIVLGILVLIPTCMWLFGVLLIDEEAIKEQILSEVSAATGFRMDGSEADFSMVPSPNITISKPVIRNSPKASAAYLMTASSLEVHIPFGQLFEDKPMPDSVTVNSPVLELEKFLDDTTNLDYGKDKATGINALPMAISLHIVDGTLGITDNKRGTYDKVTRINLDLSRTADGSIDLATGFKGFGGKSRLDAVVDMKQFTDSNNYAAFVDAAFGQGSETISYRGDLASKKGDLTGSGTLKVNLSNFIHWVNIFLPELSTAGGELFGSKIPLKFTANLEDKEGQLNANISEFVFGKMTGKFDYSESWTRFGEFARLEFDMDTIDMTGIIDGEKQINYGKSINKLVQYALPDDVRAEIRLKANSLAISENVKTNDIYVESTLEGGELVFNQAYALMPGEMKLLLFGIIKSDSENRAHLDGNIEVVGKDFTTFMEGMGLGEHISIAPDAEKFRAKANVYIAPHQSVISEVKLQAGRLLMAGGATVMPNSEHQIQITMKAANPQLSSLLPYFKDATYGAPMRGDEYETPNRYLDWLNDIHHSMQAKIVLTDYAIGDKKGQNTKLVLQTGHGRFGFDHADINFDNLSIRGGLSINQNREGFPLLKGALTISEFDLSHILGSDVRTYPVERGSKQIVWPTDKIDFGFMKGYDADLLLQVNRAYLDDMNVNNLAFEGYSVAGEWKIKQLQGQVWNGQVRMEGKMDVATIPDIDMTAFFTGVDSTKMLNDLINVNSFIGTVYVTAKVRTSGVSVVDLIRNTVGTLAIKGRKFTIKGFNLSGLTKAMPTVRSVADVVNTARASLLRSQTDFDVIEGSLYLNNGVISAHGLKLRARESYGSLEGAIDLTRWLINMQMVFTLTRLASQNLPTITLHVTESMDDPLLTPDTRSLEAYVAKRQLEN